MNFYRFYPVLAIFLLTACAGKKQQEKEPGAGLIFTDFKVSAEEGNDTVTVLLQFRDESQEEENFRFSGDGRVLLDGKPLEEGLAPVAGSFYESRIPVTGFEGKHIIEFKDREGNKHQEYFYFEPLVLTTEIPDTITAADPFSLAFRPLKSADPYIRVALTDTSYLSNGVNRSLKPENGMLTVSVEDMKQLRPGPVMMQCWLEDEKETTDSLLAGGLITVSYGVRRRFYLRGSH